MAVSINRFIMRGFSSLDKALNELTEPKFRKAALRRSGKAAMQPVHRSAIKNAPFLKDKTRNPHTPIGLLKTDIKMSTRTNIAPKTMKSGKIRTTTKHELSVMVKTGRKTEDFALIVEYGREAFVITRVVAFGSPTKEYVTISPEVEPQPFMRPALDDNYRKVFNTFRSELTKEIASQAKKQARHLAKKK